MDFSSEIFIVYCGHDEYIYQFLKEMEMYILSRNSPKLEV